MCLKEIGSRAFYAQESTLLAERIWLFNEHKELHFDNKWDRRVSSEKHDESGHDVGLDLVATLYLSCASCPRRSGLVGKVTI